MKHDYKTYIISFFITLLIFASIFGLSDFLTNKKLASLKSLQDNISLDILSSETQFSLLSDLSCKNVDQSVLSQELNSFSEKIQYAEDNFQNTDDLATLKKYYSLLEIKDYLLMQSINTRCGLKNFSVLYFYTTSDNCSECTKQGYVLTDLRNKYPNLRVYSFDYNIDLSAVRSLIAIYKVKDTELPALVINDNLVTGFQSVADIEKQIPNSIKAAAALSATNTANATSTTSSTSGN